MVWFGLRPPNGKNKPNPCADGWHPTDGNIHPLGPFPEELKRHLEANYPLTGASNAKDPLHLGVPSGNSFTGLQGMKMGLAQLFVDHAAGDIELYELKRLWSIKDDAPMKMPYYLVNVYGNAPTLDLDRAEVAKVVNPTYSQPYSLSNKAPASIVVFPDKHVRDGKTPHVWRDTNTYSWFCDDVFREAAQKAAPGVYMFTETTISKG